MVIATHRHTQKEQQYKKYLHRMPLRIVVCVCPAKSLVDRSFLSTRNSPSAIECHANAFHQNSAPQPYLRLHRTTSTWPASMAKCEFVPKQQDDFCYTSYRSDCLESNQCSIHHTYECCGFPASAYQASI